MRAASALMGARARRHEGTPVDLPRARALVERVTDSLLHLPDRVLMTSESVAGIPVVRFSSGSLCGAVLYLHGGAYVLGAAEQGAAAAFACVDGGPDVVSVDYRLAPEHPFPAAVDDALTVYRELVSTVGAARLVVAGESAGGGLLFLLLQRARSEGLPMPAGAVAAFPWADLSMSGASSTTNIGRDMLVRSDLVQEARWFAGRTDLRDPAVSPAFGSFRSLPPTYLAVGTHDLLLDDARRVAAAMVADGVDVELEEYPGALHGFTALPSRERRRYRHRVRTFVLDALDATGPRPGPGTQDEGTIA